MSIIRLVLTDLDGTVVLPGANSASARVMSSIRKAEDAGIKFAAVTGRPHVIAAKLLKRIGFKDPCIFDGGAVIMNPSTSEVLWSKSVPAATARQATKQLLPFATLIDIGEGSVTPDKIDPDSIKRDILSIWASVPVKEADKLILQLRALPGITAHANPGPAGDFSLTGIQVTNIRADKQYAVAELLKILQFDKAHTMAIGDGDNDLPLFNSASLKVAMGNAADSLKAQADHVVSSVSDDGFAESVETFLI